ncbi:hypothetical protein SAMN05421788_102470 [Filimonas lacunae]|uniref:Uncharacterized protein n=1 Tax=Filimonas lacunae TaxID=477680 RepID=A0A1N7NJ09_9BACT|nr:hypothetical protein SAMN05421788_102470 [Filimonas lacunae]
MTCAHNIKRQLIEVYDPVIPHIHSADAYLPYGGIKTAFVFQCTQLLGFPLCRNT